MPPGSCIPLIVVDAANVVGSTPNGWWRDRRGFTERLRDRLAGLAEYGIESTGTPVEVVMVVEGQASGVEPSDTVATVSARGSGDDRIVQLVAENSGRRCVVVTADRGLRSRVTALGAEVIGPSALR
ncbi:hypothetical protein P0W64_05820 [Tsukamurella sp. 8F]|uniref:hypothetical protein n=1 Tax=unclassified Tsukamurella TaxID=2633480 RepID=UPI0023B96B97|nr:MULTISPECIES: hypothetical protein [unclassified Tsukamurella]MDF0528462.1 hypothetical protein [Tsukamurella sp. 8J]MDF0586288.1 hypothetical protein [Tsukamurella sp. 8F]